MRLGVTPAIDSDIGECGNILRSDAGEKLVKCCCIFEDELIVAIKYWLRLCMNCFVEKCDIGDHRRQFGLGDDIVVFIIATEPIVPRVAPTTSVSTRISSSHELALYCVT